MKKICLIVFLVSSLFISAQELILETQVLEIQDDWDEFMIRTEAEVSKGSISRSDANNLYSGYRNKYGRRDYRQEIHDEVLQSHFKKLGVKNLGYIKNNLFDIGISPNKMDAVLGGLLRIAHSAKKEGINFNINPKMKSYFQDRLALNKSQINYLHDLAKNLSNN